VIRVEFAAMYLQEPSCGGMDLVQLALFAMWKVKLSTYVYRVRPLQLRYLDIGVGLEDRGDVGILNGQDQGRVPLCL
jgi:hypothetical protein